MSTNYIPTVPNPPQAPKSNVQDMQNNAQAIYNIWAKDHFTFDAANPGQHQFVRFPVPTTPGALSGSASALYTVADGSNHGQLYFKNDISTLQLTGVSATSNGYAWVGGILMQWASIPSASFNSNVTLTSLGLLNFSNVFAATLGPVLNSTTSSIAHIRSLTTTTINVFGNVTSIYVTIIGN